MDICLAVKSLIVKKRRGACWGNDRRHCHLHEPLQRAEVELGNKLKIKRNRVNFSKDTQVKYGEDFLNESVVLMKCIIHFHYPKIS